MAFDALAQLGAFPTGTIAFAVFLQALAFETATSFHDEGRFLQFFCCPSVGVLLLRVVTILAYAKFWITDQTQSPAVTVIFLAFGVAAVAALPVGVQRLEGSPLYGLRGLNFHIANGKGEFFLHRFRLWERGVRVGLGELFLKVAGGGLGAEWEGGVGDEGMEEGGLLGGGEI